CARDRTSAWSDYYGLDSW
nr:immunoglobulin heavy chain junction region [Macaca mulatta]MOW32538.1 immunoglobulin heavy chain junction region [Macaca mulatta]